MNVKGGTQHQINLLGIRRWTLSANSATPAGGQHTPPLSDVTRSQGAQFEIRIDGTPRSYRDRKDLALQGAQILKSRNPNSVVRLKDLESGEEVVIAFKAAQQ
ncbi:MAG: hypothetical protein WA366_13095 [Pseudolabrys sp.]